MFSIPQSSEDDLIACLHEQGTLGVEAREGVLHAYFTSLDHARASGDLVSRLRSSLGDAAGGLRLVSSEEVEDGLWHELWMASLKPLPVAGRFLIIPGPGHEAAPVDLLPIHLTPGRAFGTGEHATTRMCLELLAKSAGSCRTVLDLGTGSGILAIAARLAGAAAVVAIDIDETSVIVARRNVVLNHTDGICLAVASVEALVPAAFDLVVANISGATLLRLMPDIGSRASSLVILSGVLQDEAEEVMAAARNAGLHLVKRLSDGDWVAMSLGRAAGE